jgi:hypothetical protein
VTKHLAKFSLLVNTCESYSDTWNPFFLHLKKYWPQNSLSICFNSESSCPRFYDYDIYSPRSYSRSNGQYWGLRLLNALESIKGEFCISLYDDFFIEEPISLDAINSLLGIIEDNDDVACIYICLPDVSKFISTCFEGVVEIPKNIDYRLNSVPAIWRTSALKELTHKYDTPWSWEFFGSGRSDLSRFRFLSVENDLYKYSRSTGGAVHRGKWVNSVVERSLKEFNWIPDYEYRPLEGYSMDTKRMLRQRIDFYIHGFKVASCFTVLRVMMRRIVAKLTSGELLP